MTDFQISCMKIAKKQWTIEHNKLKERERIEKEWRETNLCNTCKERDSCKHGICRDYGYIIVGCTVLDKKGTK